MEVLRDGLGGAELRGAAGNHPQAGPVSLRQRCYGKVSAAAPCSRETRSCRHACELAESIGLGPKLHGFCGELGGRICRDFNGLSKRSKL